MVLTMAKLRMAHASIHGARKPSGPKERKRLIDGNNNGQQRIANTTMGGARKAVWANSGKRFWQTSL